MIFWHRQQIKRHKISNTIPKKESQIQAVSVIPLIKLILTF